MPHVASGAPRTVARMTDGQVGIRMVRFDGVGLRYGRTSQGSPAQAGPEVLHDLSFTLPEGGFRWLLGPSGAGKTSLLRLMYLAVRPTRGRLTIFGTDIETARTPPAAPPAPPYRHRVPGFPPAAASLGVRQRRPAAAHRRPARGPDPRRRRRNAALGRARPGRPTHGRPSCPAASSSGSRSPAR